MTDKKNSGPWCFPFWKSKKGTTKGHPGIPPDQTRPSPISKVGWGITNEMEQNQVEDLREGSTYSHVYCINNIWYVQLHTHLVGGFNHLVFFSMGRIISYIMEVIKFHGSKSPTRHIYICCNPVTSTYIELVRISPTRPAPHSSSPWHPSGFPVPVASRWLSGAPWHPPNPRCPAASAANAAPGGTSPGDKIWAPATKGWENSWRIRWQDISWYIKIS